MRSVFAFGLIPHIGCLVRRLATRHRNYKEIDDEYHGLLTMYYRCDSFREENESVVEYGVLNVLDYFVISQISRYWYPRLFINASCCSLFQTTIHIVP